MTLLSGDLRLYEPHGLAGRSPVDGQSDPARRRVLVSVKSQQEGGLMKPMRQGDLLIVPISSIPAGTRKVRRGKHGLVLAEGEATGHLHAIEDTAASLYRLVDAEQASELHAWYLLVQDKPVELTHPEHGTLTIAPGEYEVRRQRTYTPAENLRVAD